MQGEELIEYLSKRVNELREESDEEPIHQSASGICGVCGEREGKYKCPGCHMRYCMPSCLDDHKSSKTCAKDKLPTAFKRLKDYNERDMLRDFNFLSGLLERYDRSRKKLTLVEASLNKQQEMVRYKILADNAKRKGVVVKFAPTLIERHRDNISFYFTKDKALYWIFEVVLLLPGKEGKVEKKRHVSPPICESSMLKACIDGFPFADNDVLCYLGSDASQEESVEKAGLRVVIKNTYLDEENSSLDEQVRRQIKEGASLVAVDSMTAIDKCIGHMVLIEYPTIYLIRACDFGAMKDHL